MKKIAIIQARMSSSRLPGKVLLPLRNNELVLDSVINRIKKSKLIDKVLVATSTHESDNEIVNYCNQKKYIVERGSLEDVLARYYQVAMKHNGDIIVRVTADCPLVDPILNDILIDYFSENNFDYVGVKQGTLALGIATEVFSMNALKKAYFNAEFPHREHVTSYIYNNSTQFSCERICPPILYQESKKYRLTLDTQEDYIVLKSIFNNFKDEYIMLEQVNHYLRDNMHIAKINCKIAQKHI